MGRTGLTQSTGERWAEPELTCGTGASNQAEPGLTWVQREGRQSQG